MKLDDIEWCPLPPTEALRGLPNGSLVLWRHNCGIELAELIGNIPTDTSIKVKTFGFGPRSGIKVVRNFKTDAVCIL